MNQHFGPCAAGLALVLVLACAPSGSRAPTPTAPKTAVRTAPSSALATPTAAPRANGIITAAHHQAPGADPLIPATVSRVLDGDTIDVVLSGRNVRGRYFGLDTPEIGQPCAAEATERNRQLVGEQVLLERGPRATDPNGRSLFYVYTADGLMVDAILIGEGLAEAWRRDGQHKAELEALERTARAGRVGCKWSR